MFFSILLSILISNGHAFRFASFFQDGMVLQRAPQSATIFGFDATTEAEAFVSCTLNGRPLDVQRARVTASQNNQQGGSWEVTLPPQEAATECDISIVSGDEELTLTNVIFGDVWLCSGQSNMVFTMNQIFNSTEEMEASVGYTDIRFTVLKRVASDVEQEDIEPQVAWADPSDSRYLKSMSAVCFLFARSIYDKKLESGERLPLGLIDSAVGGTRVEAWSTSEGLASCGAEGEILEDNPQNSNSYLWNAMIAPLRRLNLYGFLWYQGEANSGFERDLYNCTFPTLIDTWREQFSQPEAPFGFVQLSTINYGHTNLIYPILRLHQTADFGTIPNTRMPKTFMAVSVDTYDEENGIHPRYKQVVGERLATAGMNVAYGDESFPSQGPIGQLGANFPNGDYSLTYDQPFTYDDSELSGFFFCCGQPGFCRNSLQIADWPAIEKESVKVDMASMNIRIGARTCANEGESVSLAYLWRETPIQTPVWGAPIYGDDVHRLPSPPHFWEDVA